MPAADHCQAKRRRSRDVHELATGSWLAAGGWSAYGFGARCCHPSFADLPKDELDAVARAVSEVDVAAGEALTTEGDFGHSIFAIELGTAVVSTNGRRVAEVGPGDIVSEVAVLASGRRTASVVATAPLRPLALFKRDVWTLEREARSRTAVACGARAACSVKADLAA
jgi:hypothetical protein